MHVRKLNLLPLIVAAAIMPIMAPAAEPAVEKKHAIFCLDWDAADATGPWIPFVFTPAGNDKIFLSVAKILDSGHVMNVYESPSIELEFGASDRVAVPDSEKVFNRSTWFTLFCTDYRGPTASFAIRREDLVRRLLNYFEKNPRRLPPNGVAKVIIGIQVYRLDCATNDFVKDRVMQSDYLLVKLESGHAQIVGYNFDSFTGEATGQPIALRPKANAP